MSLFWSLPKADKTAIFSQTAKCIVKGALNDRNNLDAEMTGRSLNPQTLYMVILAPFSCQPSFELALRSQRCTSFKSNVEGAAKCSCQNLSLTHFKATVIFVKLLIAKIISLFFVLIHFDIL